MLVRFPAVSSPLSIYSHQDVTLCQFTSRFNNKLNAIIKVQPLSDHTPLSDTLLDIVTVVPEEKRISLQGFVTTSFQGWQT